jgi:hypothetical protein
VRRAAQFDAVFLFRRQHQFGVHEPGVGQVHSGQ